MAGGVSGEPLNMKGETMKEKHSAAHRVATVKVDGNIARLIGLALSGYQREIRRRIEVAESTRLPGWQYLVHDCLADESVLCDWVADLNRAHALLSETDKIGGLS
jgi:hypothetical protein